MASMDGSFLLYVIFAGQKAKSFAPENQIFLQMMTNSGNMKASASLAVELKKRGI